MELGAGIVACPADAEVPFSSLGAINRLGENFCAKPENSRYLAEVQQYRAFRMQCFATSLHILDACDPPARSMVTVRLKRLDSIRRKINRPGTNFVLGTLDDVIGIRVICQSVAEVVELSHRIVASPHCYKTKDYIEAPAPTGYRGIHHIMRFGQPVGNNRFLNVRYEIQARTCLQHRWAVWSESKGERAKIGQADRVIHNELQRASLDIRQWEEANYALIQQKLLGYSGARTIAVCWRPPAGPASAFQFHDDIDAAVAWLGHLEATYPAQRGNALLLVGVARPTDVDRALRLTHPLYLGTRVQDPRLYIPPATGAS